jgi:tetratricopeptide (TPR) repeat protein
MNSWHTWSPDGKWLVFSSKAHSDYTQLYVSRMSEQGEASPPVWLAHMVETGRAANIPEFVALPADAIARIREQFLDDYSYTRAGNEFFKGGDADRAIEKFKMALSLNPNNAMAHQRLGFLLFNVKHQTPEALEHLQAAIRLEPDNGFARFDLGMALSGLGELSNAIPQLAEAVRLLPNGYSLQYNVVDMHYALAEACFTQRLYAQCVTALETVLSRTTNHAHGYYLMAMSKAWLGETETTRPYFDGAVRCEPRLAELPDYYDLLSRNFINDGLYSKALPEAEKGWQLAQAAGRAQQAAKLQKRVELCKQKQ